MNLKKFESYLRVNLLGPGPRLMKKEFTGPRSDKGSENTALKGTKLRIMLYREMELPWLHFPC
jgi:hypothetical protein